ncbi:hypothetical protein ANO11243_048010 [Dothideomycetidae sp. 11243]|nr:hypothetical protein ANO11243_048010 [fungal sp. No.11243]
MYAQRSLFRSAGQASRAFSTSAPRGLARMQIIGRLADTPESTPTSTGRDVIRYSLGVSHGPRDDNGNRATSWYRVASFTEGPQKDLLLSLPKGVSAQSTQPQKTLADKVTGSFETLSRPRNATENTGRDAAEEPASGIGAS